MEKGEKKEIMQENLQIQDIGIFQEQRSDSAQSNQQLHTIKGQAANKASNVDVIHVVEKELLTEDSMQKSEANELSCQKYRGLDKDGGLEKNTDVNNIVQQKDESSPVPAHDSVQTNQAKANAMHPEWNAFSENDLLESDRKTTVQQIVENPGKNLIFPVQDLIQTEQDGNAVQQDRERTAVDNQLESNMALQQRSETPTKLINLIPKAEESHQTWEVSDRVKVREEREQQGSVVSMEVSQTRVEARTTPDETPAQELMQREQMLKAALANFFRQQNQIIVQEAKVSRQENTPSSNKSEEMELQKLGEIVTPGESEDNRNASVRKLGENVTEYHSKSGDGVLTRSQLSKDDITAGYTEAKEGAKLEYGATILARVYDNEPDYPQPSKGYVTLHKPKSKGVTARLQKSKDYITGLPRRADDTTVGLQKTKDYVSLIPRELGAVVQSPKTKDYATFISRESDVATTKPKTTKDYVTLLPREQDVTVCASKTKDYVTVQRPESDTVTVLTPCFKDYVTFNPRESPDATMDPQKIKDYVTVRPKESDDATTRSQNPEDHEVFIPQSEEDYAFVPSSKSKGYVVMIPTKREENATSTVASDACSPAPEPPTHIFWPVRRFQENASDSETTIQALAPPRSSQETESVPESEEPHQVPVRTWQQKEELSSLCRQALILQRQSLITTPEDDDLPLMPFEECSEAAVEINEPEVQGNGRISGVLSPSLPTGIREFAQRIRELFILQGSQASFNEITAFFYGLLYGCILSAALYFLISVVLGKYDTGNSNVTSSVPDFQVNWNIPVNVIRHNRQNQSLDDKMNIPLTRVDISAIDFNVDKTTPGINLDVDTATLESNLNVIITSMADLDTEVTLVASESSIDVNASETNLDSNVVTLVPNLDVRIID